MMAAAIDTTAHELNLLSDAKFSSAGSVRHVLLVAQGAATVLPVSSEGLTGFGVLGLESISSSFGHNTFFYEFLMSLMEVYLFSVSQL